MSPPMPFLSASICSCRRVVVAGVLGQQPILSDFWVARLHSGMPSSSTPSWMQRGCTMNLETLQHLTRISGTLRNGSYQKALRQQSAPEPVE